MAKRLLTLEQAVAMLMEDSDNDEEPTVAIIPPPVEIVSEEEDINEDEMGPTGNVREVAGELEIHTKREMDVFVKSQEKCVKWIQQDNVTIDNPLGPVWLPETLEPYHDKEPFEVFKMYSEGLIDFLVVETNRYASQYNRELTTDAAKMSSFLGVLYLSGYNPLPRQDCYWSLDNDIGVEAVQESISRSEFRALKSNLHCNNNNDVDCNTKDRLFKVRKLIELANDCAKRIPLKTNEKVSVDESMIKYFGRNTLKQFIRSKPIRFGYKAWCLCSCDGFLIDFDIYQGASVAGEKETTPLGLRVIDERLRNAGIYDKEDVEVYFDNFFTSYDGMAYLKQKGVKATGTVRKNRTRNCPVDDKSLKERGDYKFMSANGITAVWWKDNSTVGMMSNFDSVEPLASANRYKKQESKKVSVPMPKMIKRYNQYMGGVDLLDSRLQLYHIGVKGKKWYWPIIAWILETFMSNSFLLYRAANGPQALDQFEFRRNVTRRLLSSTTRRVRSFNRLNQHVHRIGHMEKRRRCKVPNCPKRTAAGGSQVAYYCEVCDVPCHIECYNAHVSMNV